MGFLPTKKNLERILANLGEVTLPANLKLVERQGFGYTSKLTRVNLYSEREDVVIATNAFGYVASTTANANLTRFSNDPPYSSVL